MNKNDRLTDRTALVLTALVCSGLFALIVAFVERRVSEEWAKFIYMSLGYLVLLIYNVYTFNVDFKQVPKWKLILFQVMFYALTTGIAFLVFRHGLLPMPKRIIQYAFPMIGLSIVSVIVLGYLTKKLKFFQHSGEIQRRSL